MIRRIVIFLALTVGIAACGAPEPVAETTAPLYVDQTTGHGPFPCNGAIPGFGYADVFSGANYTGTCQRWRGDFDGGTQWSGFTAIPSYYVAMNILSARFSPSYTSGQLCYLYTTGPAYAPCAGQTPVPVFGGSGGNLASLPTMPGGAYQMVLKYSPPCPTTPGYAVLHQCTGAYTPEDGSGYVTAVVGTGIPAPGLPYGNVVNLPNSNSLAGDCIATPSTWGLTFTPPAGYPYGNSTSGRVVLVYSCT